MKNLLVHLVSLMARILQTQSLTWVSKTATSAGQGVLQKGQGGQQPSKAAGRGAQGMESVTLEDREASLAQLPVL